MSEKAYAVLLIKERDTEPSIVVGAGIFGEPSPTTNGLHCVVLFEETADTFSNACKQAEMMLSADYYDWCGEPRLDPHRGFYRHNEGIR